MKRNEKIGVGVVLGALATVFVVNRSKSAEAATTVTPDQTQTTTDVAKSTQATSPTGTATTQSVIGSDGNTAEVVVPAAPDNVGQTVIATPTGGGGGGYTLQGAGGTYNVAYPPSSDLLTTGYQQTQAQLFAELQYYRALNNATMVNQLSAEIQANERAVGAA